MSPNYSGAVLPSLFVLVLFFESCSRCIGGKEDFPRYTEQSKLWSCGAVGNLWCCCARGMMYLLKLGLLLYQLLLYVVPSIYSH